MYRVQKEIEDRSSALAMNILDFSNLLSPSANPRIIEDAFEYLTLCHLTNEVATTVPPSRENFEICPEIVCIVCQWI